MKIKNVFCSMVAMLATAMPAFAQLVQPNAPLVQPNAPLVDQQQQFAQYQMWFQNADMQLRQQTAGMSPVMQLQASVNAIRGELAQWGSFLQRYYPAVYATRCAELQQRTQKLMMLKNGGGMMPQVMQGNLQEPLFAQWGQPNAPQVDQQQQFAQYQMWFQNADMQLRQQTAGMPPVMQLQASVNAIREELAQWGSFLQCYYPAVYATRCAELQRRTQMLMMLMNGGGMPVQSARPFPRVSSGGGYARRCIACRGSGMCKQCTGTGTVHASYGGSGSWTCTSCKGSGKCSICNRYEIRRLD